MPTESPDPQHQPFAQADNSAAADHSPEFEFRQLSGDSREVLITHEGRIYRLRLTRNGKLILNR